MTIFILPPYIAFAAIIALAATAHLVVLAKDFALSVATSWSDAE